jgi:hypothetical protein
MSQNVEMGGAGSLTVAGLMIAVIFLLRSFYKRYSRAAKLEETRDIKDDESK